MCLFEAPFHSLSSHLGYKKPNIYDRVRKKKHTYELLPIIAKKSLQLKFAMGSFQYYVSKEVGGWVGWPIVDVC